jgi:CheY-like chemotaxis protein
MDLEQLLQLNGWRVLGPAATVARALRLLEDGELPDVALLDMNLRGEMVTPMAERLRALRVPFVLASAYDGAQLAALGLPGALQVAEPSEALRLLAALATAVGP